MTNIWKVDKYNQMMDINDVVDKGQFHIHGTMGNITVYCNNSQINSESIPKFSIESIDASIAGFIPESMDVLTPFPIPFEKSNVTTSVGFNLVNNIWGTNFPEWYPFDDNNINATYRFKVFV